MSFLPNPHPVFVHFTIGLYLTGVAFLLVAWVTRKDAAFQAATWNLVAGSAVTVLTVLTGWLAARGTPHADGEVHALMERHEALGLAGLGVVLLSGAAQVWALREGRPRWVAGSALALSVAGASVLLLTGAAGGKLVFIHGVGVRAVPAPAAHSHGEGHESHAHEPRTAAPPEAHPDSAERDPAAPDEHDGAARHPAGSEQPAAGGSEPGEHFHDRDHAH